MKPSAAEPGRTGGGLYHDPFVLFGYLAGCTQKLGFSTGVLILPQRQTVLVAKQAACLDVLSGGRFRLGIGVGWNEVEFTGLNENFHNRGRRSEEQVEVMQKLWAEPHVTFKGRWHTIEDAGINPRPASGKVPVWFGGHHERTLERIAKWGDGWMPNAYPPDHEATEVFDRLRGLTEAAGRDPAQVGIEAWVSMGTRQRSRLGAGSAVLEIGRRLAYLPDDDLQPPPSQAPSRPHPLRSSGGVAPLSRRRRRRTVRRGHEGRRRSPATPCEQAEDSCLAVAPAREGAEQPALRAGKGSAFAEMTVNVLPVLFRHMAIFFTSDTHFGHGGALGLYRRPFASVLR